MKVCGRNYKEVWESAILAFSTGVVKLGPIALEALGASDVNRAGPPTLYRFGREFAEALSEVDLPAIPISQLPQQFEGCFEFMDHWLWIKLDKSRKVKTSDGKLFGEGTVAVFTTDRQGRNNFFGCPIGGDFSTVDSMLDSFDVFGSTANKTADKTLFVWAINCLVYVTTGAPDLREYQPPTKSSPGTRKEKDRMVQEFGSDPCVLVSWSWLKPRRQIATQWEVSGHFWWAPVGEGRMRRELRWREGHTKSHRGG